MVAMEQLVSPGRQRQSRSRPRSKRGILIVSLTIPMSTLVADLRDLETMSMQVDGMFVPTIVVHDEAIALALLHSEQRIGVGPGLSVDGPSVVAAPAPGSF